MLPRLLRPLRPAVARTCLPSLAVPGRRLSSAPEHAIPQVRPPLASLPTADLFTFMKQEGRWHEVPDKIALRCAANDYRPITYKQLEGRIVAAAHALHALGFRHGDVINLHLHNCEQFVVSFLATAALGGVASTSNPAYTASELALQHSDSGSKLVISSRAYEAVVGEAVAQSGVRTVQYIEDADCIANAPEVDGAPPALERPIDVATDLVTLPYSSGTTGKPKGVMLTHLNLTANVLQTIGSTDGGESDTLIGVLPLFHIYGMNCLMCTTLVQRGTLVLVPKFEPQQFLQTIQEHRVTIGYLVPPIILFLAKHPLVQQYDISSIKWIISGAAPLDGATQEAVGAQLRVPIRQGWGMTELAPIGLTSPVDRDVVPGSTGVLAPSTEGLVCDAESGAALPAGELGELLIRGPQVMAGYLGRPEATAETIRADGFLRTGDLAYYDETGHVFIVDRLKELIKVKGLQVAPAEVEGALLEIDELSDAAVIGVPDERAGQVPKAFVVKRPDAAIDAAGVRAALGARLAAYKLPDEVVFVDAIPKSASGKILRRMLV